MMPRVKRLTMKDTSLLEAAAELEALCIPEPWSLSSFQSEVQRQGGVVLAAVDGDERLLGFLTGSVVADTADITNVAVHPAARRQGIGGALIRAFLEQLSQPAEIFLEVRTSNAPAIGLYEKYGFVPVGIRKRFYRHPVEDAVLMQKR